MAFFASPRFASALTIASIGTATLAFLLQRTIGWAGMLAMLATLTVFASLALFARRESLQWTGLLPLSLLTFTAWTSLSLLWSQYQWASLGGVAYLLAFTVLGLFVALTRDTIQIIRAFGDVLRVVLAGSLVLEIFSGLIIDTPIAFLNIAGRLDDLGPIQGVMGSRNQLGLVALLAAITFGTELRTKSVSRGVGIGSVLTALTCVLLSRSPIVFGVLVVVALAAGVLYGIRRVRRERRTLWQLVLLAGVALAGAVVWAFRSRIVDIFNAGGELNFRLDLWREMWTLVAAHPLEGWGWVGPWPLDVQPFIALSTTREGAHASALNAFLDVWFQLGLVGVVIFSGLVGLAFVRSWLLAGQRRSSLFAWPALILVALVATSLAESTVLTQYGWLTFVVCCVKAARELSWRKVFETPLPQAPLDEP